jgi:hypothetical protein
VTAKPDVPIAVPILFFLTAEPAGQNLTLFASEQAVAQDMDVWLARETPNATFDARGNRLAFGYRNDTARGGSLLKVGGAEHAYVRPVAGETATQSESTLLSLLREWLVARTGSADGEVGLDELIARCVASGAPVRG